MKRIDCPLSGLCVLEPQVFEDERGVFLELYNHRTFVELGINCDFVQDNQSLSRQGVLRGLHYQLGQPQAKLVRVVTGEVFDVAVDLRQGSPTFGRWWGMRLAAERWRLFFIPRGFAHGFYVLSASAELVYKCDDFYAREEERGLAWDDPDLAIEWPLLAAEPVLSPKDRALPRLSEIAPGDLPRYEP